MIKNYYEIFFLQEHYYVNEYWVVWDNYKRGGNVVSSEKCLKVPKMVIRSRKSKKDAQYVYGHKKKLTKRQRMIYKTLHRKLKIVHHEIHKTRW